MKKILGISIFCALLIITAPLYSSDFEVKYTASCKEQKAIFTATIPENYKGDGKFNQTQDGRLTKQCDDLNQSFDPGAGLRCDPPMWFDSQSRKNSNILCHSDSGESFYFYMNPEGGFEYIRVNGDYKIEAIRKGLKQSLLSK